MIDPGPPRKVVAEVTRRHGDGQTITARGNAKPGERYAWLKARTRANRTIDAALDPTNDFVVPCESCGERAVLTHRPLAPDTNHCSDCR